MGWASARGTARPIERKRGFHQKEGDARGNVEENEAACSPSNWVTSREHCVSVNTAAAPVLYP